MLPFLAENMWGTFALHCNFSAKNTCTAVIDFVSTVRLNKSSTNDIGKLIMLCITGPCFFPRMKQAFQQSVYALKGIILYS